MNLANTEAAGKKSKRVNSDRCTDRETEGGKEWDSIERDEERWTETQIDMDTHNARMNNNKHTASCPNHKHRIIEVYNMETGPSPQISMLPFY